MSRNRTRLAAAAIAVLPLVGCTSPQPSGDQPGTGPSTDPGGEPKLSHADGPLHPYRALILGDGLPPNASEQERLRHHLKQQNQIEELIAACMAKEGFDYIARIENEEVVQPESEEHSWEPEDRTWASRYGYGLLDYPGRLPPKQDPDVRDEDEGPPMSESEEQAYQEALFGPERTEDEEYDWRNHGCRGAAEHEVIGYQADLDAENQPIIQAIQEFYFGDELRSDPAFASLDAEWARCMADHDYPGFRAQYEARQSIEELLNGYYPADEDSDTRDPRLKDPAFATLDDPAYAEIAEQEVAIAVVDLDCRDRTDYNDRHLRIQFDLERQFIEDHQEELDALRVRAEQSRKR